MTTYRLELTDVADAEVQAHFARIREWDEDFARRWLEGFLQTIQKLTVFPTAYPPARENFRYYVTVRCLLYHGPSGKKGGATYRVLFHVIEPDETETQGQVSILRVRHGSESDDPT